MQHADGNARCRLLSFLFGRSTALAKQITGDTNVSFENPSVIGSAHGDSVDRGVVVHGDGKLLQPCLMVGPARAELNGLGDRLAPESKNEFLGVVEAAVEIHRADDCFERIGEDGLLVGTTRGSLAFAQQQGRAEVEASGDVGQADRVDDAGPELGQLTFGKLGIPGIDLVGNDHAQHGVAKKLQALVRFGTPVFGAPRTMRER